MSETISASVYKKVSVSNKILSILSISKLNIKSIFSTKALGFEILFIILLTLIIPIIFIPIVFAGSIITIIGVCIPVLLMLGSSGYQLKKSSIYGNINTSGVSNGQFNISLLLTSILFANLISFALWSIITIIGLFPIFLGVWIFEGSWRVTFSPFSHGAWINIIYVTQVCGLLCFATYYLISSFAKNNKSYYMVIMAILILAIIFGGSINTYFSFPYKYTVWDLWETPLAEGSYVHIDKPNQIIYINDIAAQSLYEAGPNAVNQNGITTRGGLFPDTIFIPTLFYPYYGVGEFSTCAITKHIMQDSEMWFDVNIYLVSGPEDLTNATLLGPMVLEPTSLKWSSWYKISFAKDAWQWTAVLLQPIVTSIVYILIGTARNIAKTNVK